MVTIITTDIHVKIIENGIINIKDYPAAEFDSVQMNANQPTNLQGSRQRH